MARAISNRNVLNARFDTAPFDGEFLASFGRPELRGSWTVWGGSGSGKTTFVLALCKYLAQFCRVAYDSLEQGLSLSFQHQWKRAAMHEAGRAVVLLEKEGIADLKERLRRRGAPRVVVIDSLMCLVGFTRREYLNLIGEFSQTLFIFVSHEKNRRPDPAVAETIRRLSDVKIHVEGYVAQVTTRYADPVRGEGGADFVIWPQGAAEYRATAEAVNSVGR